MSERANKRLKLCAEISTGTQMQTKLTSFIESSNMEYQECLLDWMVSSYQPFSAIQNDSFRKMVHSLNKKAPVIGEDKIRSLMSMKYFETMQSITKIVKGKDVALTTDAWTSIAKEGYVTCTLHFIEPLTWTLHDFSLGIFKKDGTSTAIDVVRYAEDQMKKFSVSYPQLTCIVTDTESTMIAAGRLFKEKSVEAGGTTSWHGCIDHKLELVTKLAFKDTPESNGTMAACRAIVTFFNSSSQATEKLKEKTKARLGTALTVIQDVVTRWWSTFSMCERLLRLRNTLTVMHLDGDMRLFLTEAQWTVVMDLTVLLRPFMIAQRLLEGQSYVTISLIPYMLYKIRSGLTSANTDPSSSIHVQSISTLMIAKFNEEFGTGEENTVAMDHTAAGNRRHGKGIPKRVLLAMCLDPRTKSTIGIPPADRLVIWRFIEEELVEVALNLGPPEAPAAAAPLDIVPVFRNNHALQNDIFLHELDEDESSAIINVEDTDDDLRELNDANDGLGIANLVPNGGVIWCRETVMAMIQSEVQLYKAAKGMKLRDPHSGLFNNPLDWWRVHASDFPHLAKLALKYLSIPATSAPSERVFSTAGLTIAKDRARLEASRANELVFLHDSVPALKKYNAVIEQRNHANSNTY